MHGLTNLMICVAKQAKQTFQYKIKIKLYKNNAAILFINTCRIKQITPNYIKQSPFNKYTRPAENENTRGYIIVQLITGTS
jgi:hypothetical protein